MKSADIRAIVAEMYDIYSGLKQSDSKAMFRAVDRHDRWWLEEAPLVIARELSFKAKRFSGMDSADTVVAVARKLASEARTKLSAPITAWVTGNYDAFYRAGVRLAALNGKAEGKRVRQVLDKADANSIELQVRQELDVWKGHWSKHERQVERELVGFVLAGGTIDQFLGRMTAPSGHIVAFPYGNSRQSWYELIRKMVTVRGRQVASVAQQHRLV
jgi:hypothetical protein